MSQTVRIVTINQLKNSSRWADRRKLLASGLAALKPDMIGLQEVAIHGDFTSAHELAADLGGYQVAVARRAGWWRRGEGVAILSRFPILKHESIHLAGGEGRTAQFIRVEVAGRPLVCCNGHYLWRPLADQARAHQIAQVLYKLRCFDPGITSVAIGDFNAVPDSDAIATARMAMTSAHLEVHGREPDFTCPTPLDSGNPIYDGLKSIIFRLCSNQPNGPWRATLDYIFVSSGIRVVSCAVCLNQPSTTDSTLYPSDHFGLVADLELIGEQRSRFELMEAGHSINLSERWSSRGDPSDDHY